MSDAHRRPAVGVARKADRHLCGSHVGFVLRWGISEAGLVRGWFLRHHSAGSVGSAAPSQSSCWCWQSSCRASAG